MCEPEGADVAAPAEDADEDDWVYDFYEVDDDPCTR